MNKSSLEGTQDSFNRKKPAGKLQAVAYLLVEMCDYGRTRL
jgi:hypothetical protein